MEFLHGQTLAERLQKGPQPVEQVLKLAIEIAKALEKAHQQGIIHRDLKPANIMLAKAGGKLMDFGLAKGRILRSPPGRRALYSVNSGDESGLTDLSGVATHNSDH